MNITSIEISICTGRFQLVQSNDNTSDNITATVQIKIVSGRKYYMGTSNSLSKATEISESNASTDGTYWTFRGTVKGTTSWGQWNTTQYYNIIADNGNYVTLRK